MVKPSVIPLINHALPLQPIEEPMNEAAYRRHAGTGADKHGILQRIAQSEQSMGTMKTDGLPFRHIAKKIGKKAIFHTVQAEIELRVIVWSGSDGVGAGDLASFFIGQQGEKLARGETELIHVLNGKFHVAGLLRQLDSALQLRNIDFPFGHISV